MLRIPFEWLEFGFECFESLSSSNLDLNASNPFRMVQICVRMLRNLFEWFKFAFERFESLLNGLNLHSNASNAFRMPRMHFECFESIRIVRTCIRMLRLLFEWFKFAVECFESQMVRICIRMLQIPFEWFKLAIEFFEFLSNRYNLHSNASNLVSRVRIWI